MSHVVDQTSDCAKGSRQLPQSIQSLIQAVREQDRMTPVKARDLMKASGITAADCQPWADFGHPAEDCYGRQLVFAQDDFEIMVMSWAPGDFSAIHDHGSTQWGAVQIFGHAEHAVFSLRDGQLHTKCRTAVEPGEVNAVDHDLIHQMGNPGKQPFLSLHMYGADGHQGEITGNARLFDLFENQVQYTDGGVFFCLPEHAINGREPGPRGDFATTLRHDLEMFKRIRRILHVRHDEKLAKRAKSLKARLLGSESLVDFGRCLATMLDRKEDIKDRSQWRLLWHEVKLAAGFKEQLSS